MAALDENVCNMKNAIPTCSLILIFLLVVGELAGVIKQSAAAWRPATQLALRYVIPPEHSIHYQELPILPRQVGQLTHDGAERYVRRFSSGEFLEIFTLWFNPGNPQVHNDIKAHSPEVCMAAAGATIEQVFADLMVELPQLEQTLHLSSIEIPNTIGNPVFIMKATWFPDPRDHMVRHADYLRRVRSAVASKDRPPGLVVMGSLLGARSYEHAKQLFLGDLKKNLRLVTLDSSSG